MSRYEDFDRGLTVYHFYTSFYIDIAYNYVRIDHYLNFDLFTKLKEKKIFLQK